MIKRLDIGDLANLYDLTVPIHKELSVGTYSPDNCLCACYEGLINDNLVNYGYYDGDRLVGFISVYVYKDYDVEPKANINHFVVLPEYRNRVVANKLLEKAIKVCDDMGCIRIYAANTSSLTERQQKAYTRFMSRFGFDTAVTVLMRGK